MTTPKKPRTPDDRQDAPLALVTSTNDPPSPTVTLDRNDLEAAADDLASATQHALDAWIDLCPGGHGDDNIAAVVRLIHGARDILVRASGDRS